MAKHHQTAFKDAKTTAFLQAMHRYNTNPWYTYCERLTSSLVVSLQILSLVFLFVSYDQTGLISIILALGLGYVLADFINGLVHMFMDNNTHYTSFLGPLIASFHLHHIKMHYPTRGILQNYFYESGTKFWLLGYLILLTLLQYTLPIPSVLQTTLVALGIFSSIAELSHYWCHNGAGQHKWIVRLQQCGLLLNKKHHRIHHSNDNMQYAFLNGISDPLINRIAQWLYSGYKQRADTHAKAYIDSLLTME